MPEGSSEKYFIGRLHGDDAAAIGSIPEGRPTDGDVEHLRGRSRSADDAAARGPGTRAARS
jgi:hypothetical protein